MTFTLTEYNTFESLTTLKSEYSISRSDNFWWEACEKLIEYTIDGITEISDNIILDNSDGFRSLKKLEKVSIENIQNYVKVGITNLLFYNDRLINGMQADLKRKKIVQDLLDSLSRIIRIQLNQYQKIYPAYPAQFSRNNVPAIEGRSDPKTKNLGVSTSSLRYSLMKN